MPGRVAVIGAGAIGLSATKVFIEDGWTVTTYESRDYVGGLWKDSDDSTISVHATTIFNSSKYRAALTDFPFADTDNDYPTAIQLHEYLKRYANHFGLMPSIKLGIKVLNIQRDGNRWKLKAQRKSTGEAFTEYFDKVCVATGSQFTPRWPKLEGLDQFQGKALHSIDFHRSEEFKDQNVLLVGMHATAQDVTNALSEHAKHVYLSHRGGILLVPRFNADGSVMDSTANLTLTFIGAYMTERIPGLWYWIVDKMLRKMSEATFPEIPETQGLNHDAPSFGVSPPLIGDIFYPLLKSKFAESIPAISRITGPRSVELTDGRILEDVDSIIYCTGYDFNIPEGLVADDLNPYPGHSVGQPPKLYHNIFSLHPDASIRNSLAYLGQNGITLPGLAQHELNAMAISQTWLENSPLPSHEKMLAWYRGNLAEREGLKTKYKPREGSNFTPAAVNFGEHLRWVDETAGTGLYKNLGLPLFNWHAWSLWWQDKELYNLCVKGLFTPVIWRLFETGKRKALPRDECRKIIVMENERLQDQIKRRKESKKLL